MEVAVMGSRAKLRTKEGGKQIEAAAVVQMQSDDADLNANTKSEDANQPIVSERQARGL
jgi:hypothetical protein